jgi:hypothetical protein
MVEEIGPRRGAPYALPELHGRKHADAPLLRSVRLGFARSLPCLRFRSTPTTRPFGTVSERPIEIVA